MENQSCFVCGLVYELSNRKPLILGCCRRNICSECLEKIFEKETQACPFCREPFKQESHRAFSLDIVIEERLNFEELGEVTCDQCEKNPLRKATKKCLTCGFICGECYDSHNRMKIFKTHEISTVPVEHWSKNLEKTLKASLKCEKHKEKIIGSFCKNCQKTVCEECVMESHEECQSKICTIDQGYEETVQDLQKDVNIDVNRIERIFLENMKNRQSEIENIERKTKEYRVHCFETLKRFFDEGESAFQDKAHRIKYLHEKTNEKLQWIKHAHSRLHSFVQSAPSLHNKVGVLQQALKVKESIAILQIDIRKTEKDMEVNEATAIEYLSSIEEAFSKINLNEKKCVGFSLDNNEIFDSHTSTLNKLFLYKKDEVGQDDDDFRNKSCGHTKEKFHCKCFTFILKKNFIVSVLI